MEAASDRETAEVRAQKAAEAAAAQSKREQSLAAARAARESQAAERAKARLAAERKAADAMRLKRETEAAALQAAEERALVEEQVAAAAEMRRAEGARLSEARGMRRARALARLRGWFYRLSGVTALALAAFALGFGANTAWMRTEIPAASAFRGNTSSAQRPARPGWTGVEPAPTLRLDEDASAFARRTDAKARNPAKSRPLRATKEPDAADSVDAR